MAGKPGTPTLHAACGTAWFALLAGWYFLCDSWNGQYTSAKYFGSGELAFAQVTSFQQRIPNLPWT